MLDGLVVGLLLVLQSLSELFAPFVVGTGLVLFETLLGGIDVLDVVGVQGNLVREFCAVVGVSVADEDSEGVETVFQVVFGGIDLAVDDVASVSS